jgi:SAM-dependent methyltransferase
LVLTNGDYSIVNDLFKRRSDRPYLDSLLPRLEHWFNGSKGQQVLASQQLLINENIKACFGYHLLQLSVSSSVRLFDESSISNKYCCHPIYDPQSVQVQALFESLPFANESIDLVVLHHAHEFVDNPHELLREIQRVIIPGGRIIIVGFNPWCTMGAKTLYSRFVPNAIWQNHLLSKRRMADWLGLLGFSVELSDFGYHTPKIVEAMNRPRLNKWLRSAAFGDYYVLRAIKQTATLTPLKPKWGAARNGFSVLTPAKSRVASYEPATTNKTINHHSETDF